MVRISLGAYNTPADVGAAVEMLVGIADGLYQGGYERTASQEYIPVGGTQSGMHARWTTRPARP